MKVLFTPERGEIIEMVQHTRLRRMVPGSPPEVLVVGLGHLSQAQLGKWERQVESPWVLSTVLEGYKLQLRRRPSSYRDICVTSLADGVRKQVLRLEIEPLERLSGFHSTYSTNKGAQAEDAIAIFLRN